MIGRLKERERLVRIGDRAFLTRGLDSNFWNDAFHNMMSVSWPVFFAGFAFYFLVMNTIFAFFYWLGGDCIANAHQDSMVDLFFFSIETLATVGYGDMHPQTTYGHLVATVEIFTGMSTLAVFTGLIFARFSRPRAQVQFADCLALSPHNGRPTLMARFANARRSSVNMARAEIWFLFNEYSAEGAPFRRFRQLPLTQPRNPIFAFSWLLFHQIDEASPLFGMTGAQMEEMDAYFLVIFDGLDDVSGQTVNVRKGYSWSDIRFGEMFSDVLTLSDGDVPEIDYRRLSATEAFVAGAETGAR